MSEGDSFELGHKVVFGLVIGILTTIAFIAFVSLLATYKANILYTPSSLRAEIITTRFTHNPTCFAYEDPVTKRIYGRSIDLTKFTTEQMNACYAPPQGAGYERYNFQLVLEKNQQEVRTNNYYYSADDFTLYQKVLVYDGTTFKPDTLIIYVQEPWHEKGLNGQLNSESFS